MRRIILGSKLLFQEKISVQLWLIAHALVSWSELQGASLPVNILMKVLIDAQNEGPKQQGCVQEETNEWNVSVCVRVCARVCVCVRARQEYNKTKWGCVFSCVCVGVYINICICVCEGEGVYELGSERAVCGEWVTAGWEGGNQPPAAMTGFDLHCSLSLSLPLSLCVSLSLPHPPLLSHSLSFRLPFLPCDRSAGSFQKRRGGLTVVKTLLGAALSALMVVTGR